MRMKLEIEKRQQVCVTHRPPKTSFLTNICYTLFEVKKYDSLQYVTVLTHCIYLKTNHICLTNLYFYVKTHLLQLQSELFTVRTK